MSLKGKISEVGGCLFGMTMRKDSLMEFFFFDDGCLGKVPGSKKKVVVVEMIVGIVEMVVLANLEVLLEVVILVQLMVWGWTWEIVVEVTEGVL